MSTSKPMSDGGKGSVRRNEDNDAYRNNYDAIFGAKAHKSSPTAAGKTEKEQPMMNDDPQERSDEDNERSEFSEDGEWFCKICGGPKYSSPHWSYGQCEYCGGEKQKG